MGKGKSASVLSVREWLGASVDASSVAVFRVAFGLVMAWSSVRFVAKGWIEAMLVAPRFHFAYPGFEWIAPWPEPWLYAHFALMTVAALGVAFGLFYRVSALLLFLTFTSAELFDQTYYLNHYYLASLCAGLCCVLPLQRAWSLDAWRAARSAGSSPSPPTVPRAVPVLLRAQLAIVYGFAGLAKLDADWLLRGEPLRTWLQVHAELPLVGSLLQLPGTALVLSWAGALFDLSIVPWLCSPRTRVPAYGAVLAFHALTALLFPIGVFPWLMIALTPIFFAHDWPRRWLSAIRPAGTAPVLAPAHGSAAGRPLAAVATGMLALYVLVQLLLPLRHLAYPGAVNWSEQGFRWAWRVMLIEKTGHVAFRVLDRARGEQLTVAPEHELTARQLGQMSTQPVMIAAYARHLADEYRARGHHDVSVYADAWASLNGRPAQRLLDPHADLAQPRPLLASDPAILPLHN